MAGSASIMTAVQTLLQALSDFDNLDVTQGDFRVLDRGSAPYAVIYPGGLEVLERSDDGRQVLIRWRHYVEVFATFLDDDYSNLVSARAAVVEQLNIYPSLNGLGGITRAFVEGGDDLQFLYPPGGDVPAFVFVRLSHFADELIFYRGQGEFS
jgi:hypothetical protein